MNKADVINEYRNVVIEEIFKIFPDDRNYLDTLNLNQLVERLNFFRSLKKSVEKIKQNSVR